MKLRANPEIARAINQQAHTLAAQSFASIRTAIQDKTRELLREGKTADDVIRAIRMFTLERRP